jgi:hypothetical protein
MKSSSIINIDHLFMIDKFITYNVILKKLGIHFKEYILYLGYNEFLK